MKKNSIFNAGVDEAGRGCVLGPLVLAIVVIDEEQTAFFKQKGIKDSKLLSKKAREEFFPLIVNNSKEHHIGVISVEELNLLMNTLSLNKIEADHTAKLVFQLNTPISKLIVDCPGVNTQTYKKTLMHNFIREKYDFSFEIISEHKADLNYVCVACASILAKVTRDRLLKELVGSDISGYSSDPKTIDFLKNYILEHKKIPAFARDKWETITNIMNELYQKKLGWFDDKKS